MKKKEHFEVMLEDKDDSDKRNDETNKFLKFAKDDSDKRNDETNKFLKFVYGDLDKKIQDNGLKIGANRTLIKENSKKIENNGTKIEENQRLIKGSCKLIEEDGKKFETLGKKQHNYEERLILLEKRCC